MLGCAKSADENQGQTARQGEYERDATPTRCSDYASQRSIQVFRCLFCQHHGSVLCKMDRSNRIGRLDCKDCMQSFQAAITRELSCRLSCLLQCPRAKPVSRSRAALDEAVDLYSMWIDACEAVNVQDAAPSQARAAPRRAARGSDNDDEEEEDDDDDLAAPPSRRAAAEPQEEEDDDDDNLPELPGHKQANTSNGRSGAPDEEDDDAGEQDADASIDRSAPVDMGYERQPVNAKMAALLEQRKAKATQVVDDSDDE